MKINEKKKEIAEKMHGKGMKEGHNLIGGGKIYNKLYPGGFNYKNKKGRESLNPVQKSKDNMSMEGRNEQEKN